MQADNYSGDKKKKNKNQPLSPERSKVCPNRVWAHKGFQTISSMCHTACHNSYCTSTLFPCSLGTAQHCHHSRFPCQARSALVTKSPALSMVELHIKYRACNRSLLYHQLITSWYISQRFETQLAKLHKLLPEMLFNEQEEVIL